MASASVRQANMLDLSVTSSGAPTSAPAMVCASPMASASVLRDGWAMAAKSQSAQMPAMATEAA